MQRPFGDVQSWRRSFKLLRGATRAEPLSGVLILRPTLKYDFNIKPRYSLIVNRAVRITSKKKTLQTSVCVSCVWCLYRLRSMYLGNE